MLNSFDFSHFINVFKTMNFPGAGPTWIPYYLNPYFINSKT